MVPEKEKKHKKSKSKDKEKKKQQDKKTYSSISEDELFNDEAEIDDDDDAAAINLDEELHPIGYYINDRKAMLDQVFSVTPETKIRAMLPPILKGSTNPRRQVAMVPKFSMMATQFCEPLALSELKTLCLDQLLGMSSKRIHSILDGQQLDSSSATDDVEDGSDLEPKTEPVGERKKKEGLEDIDGFEMSGPDNDTLEIGITSKEMGDLFTDDADLKVEKKKEKFSEKKLKHVPKKKHKKRSDKEKKKPEKENKHSEEDTCESKKAKPAQKETVEEDKGKSLLEILELEMRARAIRALLREHGDSPVRPGDSRLREGSIEFLGEQAATIKIKQEKPSEQKNLKRTITESASQSRHATLMKMDTHSSRRIRHPKKILNLPVKTEVIDVDSDASVEIKEVINVIHSDLETVSSGEEVFIDMKEKADAAREDGELSSVDGGAGNDDDIIEVKYDSSKEDIIVVEDSDGDVKEVTEVSVQALSDISDQTDEIGMVKGSLSPHRKGSVGTEECTESWAQRWLQSKGVQKVVTDSKMFARVHKRMKTVHKGRPLPERVKAVPSVEVIGSVEEYRSLQRKSGRK